ncbi:hypothetical protein [Pedobacter sp. V48]|uniref:hypothetical protein n=1 Tax=Pedobacter sp. V48 TaxID=509635 RepID=UPI0003E50B47|nr:hypothetical protein [Pedobacter sp. V48]ETZ21923.1 hypothetical protein N824_25840 [Pedobacter sp. V48]
MKNTSILILAIISISYLASCKKGKDGPSNEEILKNKIEDVIPQQYLDTLKTLNFPVNEGTTPPNMEGAFYVSPLILRVSNILGDKPGNAFLSSKVKFFDQHNDDFGISLIGEHVLTLRDTSIVTAISGSGNNFTIYGKVKSTYGSYSAIFATIISGIKEGNNIKNYTIGIINIDNSKGGTGIFVPEGKARVAYDSDLITESIEYDSKTAKAGNERILNLVKPLGGR